MSKIKTLFLGGMLIFLLSGTAIAENQQIKVSINGLVCDFCARALEKVFGRKDEVRNIDVNLSAKLVTITLNKDKLLDDEVIRGLIRDAGYTISSIERTP